MNSKTHETMNTYTDHTNITDADILETVAQAPNGATIKGVTGVLYTGGNSSSSPAYDYVRHKMNDLVDQGRLRKEKDGRSNRYFVAEEQDEEQQGTEPDEVQPEQGPEETKPDGPEETKDEEDEIEEVLNGHPDVDVEIPDEALSLEEVNPDNPSDEDKQAVQEALDSLREEITRGSVEFEGAVAEQVTELERLGILEGEDREERGTLLHTTDRAVEGFGAEPFEALVYDSEFPSSVHLQMASPYVRGKPRCTGSFVDITNFPKEAKPAEGLPGNRIRVACPVCGRSGHGQLDQDSGHVHKHGHYFPTRTATPQHDHWRWVEEDEEWRFVSPGSEDEEDEEEELVEA